MSSTAATDSSFWDERATRSGELAKVLWRDPWYSRWFHEAQLRLMEQLIGELGRLRVLEIGSGTGRLLRALEERGSRVVGADYSVAMSREARALGLEQAIVTDIRAPCFRPGAFDLVMTSSCLVLLPLDRRGLKDVLTEMVRLVHPRGGRILLMEPIHYWFNYRARRQRLRDFIWGLEDAGARIEVVAGLGLTPLKGLMLARTHTRLDDALLRWSERLTTVRALRRLYDYKVILARREERR